MRWTHQLLAMEALGGLLGGVNKECVWYMLPALQGSVNPQWSTTPDLGGAGVNGRVGHTIGAFQASAVVGDTIGTLLVVVPLTPWRTRGRRGRREGGGGVRGQR